MNLDSSGETPRTPKRGSVAAVAVTFALLALLVWGLHPRRPKIRPALLLPPSNPCSAARTDFVPSNLTSIPGLSLEKLPPAVRNQVLLRLNLEPCPCGCKLSLAACLASNPSCTVARRAAEAIVKDAETSARAATAPPGAKPGRKP